MKFITFIIALIWSLSSSAQTLSDIKLLLLKRNVAAFEGYVDSVHRQFRHKPETYIMVRSELKREICPPFHEVIVDIDEIVYGKDTTNTDALGYYRINLIATDSQFVYYTFVKHTSKSAREKDVQYETFEGLRHDKLIDSLQTLFLHTYGTKLNWNELFVNTNIYGKWCGIAVSKPAMRNELEAIVAEKNKKLLTKWLKSANAEKQMYAIDGLYQLKQNGYKLTAEQQRLIDVIRKKKGKVITCSGCIWSNDQISRVVEAIVEGREV